MSDWLAEQTPVILFPIGTMSLRILLGSTMTSGNSVSGVVSSEYAEGGGSQSPWHSLLSAQDLPLSVVGHLQTATSIEKATISPPLAWHECFAVFVVVTQPANAKTIIA
jgi:hypothetical protein